MAEKKFESKWLEGLKFNYAEKNMVDKNGRKTLQAIPKQRKLEEDDVLGWTEYPDRVVIATKDGRKYTVSKKKEVEQKEKK